MAGIEQALATALKELCAEKERIEIAISRLESLTGPTSSQAPRRGRKPGRKPGQGRPKNVRAPRSASPRNGKAGRSSKGSVQVGRLLSYIAANPWQRMELISTGMGVKSKVLKPQVKRLVVDAKLKAKGKARGTTYAVA